MCNRLLTELCTMVYDVSTKFSVLPEYNGTPERFVERVARAQPVTVGQLADDLQKHVFAQMFSNVTFDCKKDRTVKSLDSTMVRSLRAALPTEQEFTWHHLFNKNYVPRNILIGKFALILIGQCDSVAGSRESQIYLFVTEADMEQTLLT